MTQPPSWLERSCLRAACWLRAGAAGVGCPTLLLPSWERLLRSVESLLSLPDAQQGAHLFPAGRVTFQSSSGQLLPCLRSAPLPADHTVQDSFSPQCLGPSTLLWSVRLWLGTGRGRLDEKPVILLWHLALHFLYARCKNHHFPAH